MSLVQVLTRAGKRVEIKANADGSLMESIRDANIEIVFGVCGVSCSCGTCHVYLDPSWQDRLGGPNAFEADILAASDFREPCSRLSCQIKVSPAIDGLVVRVAPEE